MKSVIQEDYTQNTKLQSKSGTKYEPYTLRPNENGSAFCANDILYRASKAIDSLLQP